MHPISKILHTWYSKNKRDLPWRQTTDPYKIWLSEVILQQTQVVQGMNYYLKFINTYPTITHLANANEDKVLTLWQGLGYYSRARNLHFTAIYICKELKGKFPKTYSEIIKLKGVGAYTAAAIASIAYNEPYAAVDGNVYRVIARLFNVNTPINTTEGKKEFQIIANDLIKQCSLPGLHNNAMMEFGALQCKPTNPLCDTCVLQTHCLAFQKQVQNSLPVKNKTVVVKNRYFNYIVFTYKFHIYIHKRTEKDIWQNLFEFYLIETKGETTHNQVLENNLLQPLKIHIKSINAIKPIKHKLTHQILYTQFIQIDLKTKLSKTYNLQLIKQIDLTKYAFPQPIQRYIEGSLI